MTTTVSRSSAPQSLTMPNKMQMHNHAEIAHGQTTSSAPAQGAGNVAPEARNHSHAISAADKNARRRLIAAAILSFIFFIVELVGSNLSNSLAIFADSLHMLVDLLALLLALAASYISHRKATKRHSFGFHRIEIISAFASIFTIWVLTGFLVKAGIGRINDPKEIESDFMLIIAAVGLAVNILTMFILGHRHHGHGHDHSHHQAHDNINVRAAMLHIIGDVVSSVGVLISAITIKLRPEWAIIDPICTFFFATIVMATTIKLFRDTVTVLMEATPTHIDPSDVERDLRLISFVENVHDLHIWTLTAGKVSLAVHIEVAENLDGSCYEHVLAQAQTLLCNKYQVHHTTIQVEARRRDMAAHCLSSICHGGMCPGESPSLALSTDPLLSSNVSVQIPTFIGGHYDAENHDDEGCGNDNQNGEGKNDLFSGKDHDDTDGNNIV